MSLPACLRQTIVLLSAALLLAGCAFSGAPSTATPSPRPPTATPPQEPGTPLPYPPTPAATVRPAGKPSLFRFIRTVEVVPDALFQNGAFARVNYVLATDLLVVTFAGRLSQPAGECQDSAHGYKGYTLDLEPTGESGVLNCEVADMAGVMVDNTYYDVSMHAAEGQVGWRIMEFDTVRWERLADIFVPLQSPQEKDGDPMAAFVNGALDVSSLFSEGEQFPAPDKGASTHHRFFSRDLQFLERRFLADTPHINGSSMIYVDGSYYLITATSYAGDLIAMRYDGDWDYLGKKRLIEQANFPTGVAWDGSRFFVAYANTSQRTTPGFFPVYPNVHLAAFDRDWNLLEEIAVTDYPASEKRLLTRPGVLLLGNRLYVSYDEERSTDETGEGFVPGRAFVTMYELVQSAP